MSIWVSNSSSNWITRAQNALLIMSYSYMSCSLWVTDIIWVYRWATHRLAELLALKMHCSLWVTHYQLLIHELLIMSYSYMSCSLWITHILWAYGWATHWVAELLALKMRCSSWITHYELLIHELLIMSYLYMSCSLWVTHILWAYGWATHRLAELLALKMHCSLRVTNTWVAHYELLIHYEHMGEQLIE